VDPDPGVEGEALEEGAAANVRERVGIPEPPIRLGGLERGQRVVLELLVVGGEDLDRPPDDAPEDGLHVLVLRRGQRNEASGALLLEFEDPVRRQAVEVDVQIDRAPSALDRSDATGPWIGRPEPASGLALPGEDGPHEDVEQARGEGRMACREEAHPAREREDPLPHRDGREDVADEVVGAVLHAAGGARGADRGFAGKGDEPLEAAVRASDPCETSGQ
jgi:hypothetical protein